jgi:3-hydroxy-3-methylglutaryl CoA synthase
MLQSLGLPQERDYATYPWLGNTGSVALPVTLALAVENGFVQPGQNVALLGIGSGINSLMIAAHWQQASLEKWRRIESGHDTANYQPAPLRTAARAAS